MIESLKILTMQNAERRDKHLEIKFYDGNQVED